MMERFLGRPLFGKADDDAIIPCFWHSQNLDTRPGDGDTASGSKLMHGRAWLHLTGGKRRRPVICIEWSFRSNSCHANLSVDDSDREVSASFSLPPVAFYLNVEGLPNGIFKALGVDYETVKNLPDGVYLCDREIRVSVHDWALWWSLWMPSMMSRSGDPRWRKGNFNFIDAIFGRSSFKKEIVEAAQAVLVPMPERNYRGTVTLERRTWARPRWPFRRGPRVLFHESLGYDLKMEDHEQIPFPGKGENSWDCGDDALFSQSGEGGVTEAIASVVQSVLRNRRKYGGSIAWKPEPTPPINSGGAEA